MSLEFDNLVDGDANQADVPQYGTSVTDQERLLVSERKFHDLVQYQIHVDAEIEAQLRRQEDQLRQEEEALYEARRQAARAASRLKATGDEPGHDDSADGDVSWVSAIGTELVAGEEDFEQFLASAESRTLNTQLVNNSLHIPNMTGGGGDATVDKPTSVSPTVARPDLIAIAEIELTRHPHPLQVDHCSSQDWEAEFVSAAS
jgi:hypothetical protein